MSKSIRLLRTISAKTQQIINRRSLTTVPASRDKDICRVSFGLNVHEARHTCQFSSHSDPFGTSSKTENVKTRQQQHQAKGLPTRLPIPGVDHVILVASGKGGVGKSTTAVNLAVALSQAHEGSKVGILDADIYGPSIPTLMNLTGEPELNHQNLMLPLVNYGIKCMSMGFLVEEKAALVWRGLMVMAAVQRLIRQVVWGPLDYLVVDMPPGTGDVQLSISQNIPVSGSVIVTTPQDLALIDARRAVTMFSTVGIPNLGIVENMSVYVCPKCGHQEHIFGQGGARGLQEQTQTEILGHIPLTMSIRELSDSGQPLVISRPDGAESQVYKDVAAKLISKLKDAAKTS